MPGLQRIAQSELDAERLDRAHQREPEFNVRRKPARIKWVACSPHFGNHVIKVHLDESGQHVAVVQLGTPAGGGCLVGRVPEPGHQRAQQQLLHDAHARVRRHLECTQFQQAQAARGRIRRVHLVDGKLAAVRVACGVDQQVAQRAVHQPRRHRLAIQLAVGVNLLNGDLQLVQLVVARLVHPWCLAGGADEHAAEQVTQRGVVVPEQQQAGKQLGLAQKRAVGRRGAAHHKVVAATGAGVAAVGHEFFGRQARLKRRVVQKLGIGHQFAPGFHRVDVDLDHAGVRRDLQQLEARVARWRVAFQHQLETRFFGRRFDGRQQVKVSFELVQGRHEDVQHA